MYILILRVSFSKKTCAKPVQGKQAVQTLCKAICLVGICAKAVQEFQAAPDGGRMQK